MPFSSALSTLPDGDLAFEEARALALASLPNPPDLAFLFFSAAHARWLERQFGTLQDRLGVKCLLGCGGESIVGAGQEVEQGPALVLWLASWANPVWMEPFHLVGVEGPAGPGFQGMPESVALRYPQHALLLLLGDPFSFRADLFLHLVNRNCPGLRVAGGQASGGRAPGQCKLLLDRTLLDRGAAGLLLSGSFTARTVVAQGCKPVGNSLIVTGARENLILEIDGQPPLVRFQQVGQSLAARDRQLLERELLVGQIVDDAGNFLVRPVLGLDRGSGALTLDARLQPGQAVRLLVRDPESAGKNFQDLLRQELSGPGPLPGGALLFTCTRRGSRLFPGANQEIGILQEEAGNVPVAGFFALGEFGPTGGQNYLHAHAASVVVFGEG